VLAAVTAILCGGTAGAAETAGAATITRHVVAQDRAADQWSPKPGYNSTDNGDGTYSVPLVRADVPDISVARVPAAENGERRAALRPYRRRLTRQDCCGPWTSRYIPGVPARSSPPRSRAQPDRPGPPDGPVAAAIADDTSAERRSSSCSDPLRDASAERTSLLVRRARSR
jgi:hypothetical protein